MDVDVAQLTDDALARHVTHMVDEYVQANQSIKVKARYVNPI